MKIIDEMRLVTLNVLNRIHKKHIVLPETYFEVFIEECSKLEIDGSKILNPVEINESIFEQVETLKETTEQSIVAINNKDVKELLNIKSKVSELSSEISELKQLLYQDPLTTSYNRRYLYNHLIDNEHTFIKDGIMTIIDLNHLKYINDTLGHTIGDKVIKLLSAKLTEKFDIVIRYGGDEFLIFTEHNLQDMYMVFHSMREELLKRFVLAGQKKFVMTFSFGSASFDKGDTFDDVFDIADMQMYKDKESIKEKYDIDYLFNSQKK